MAKKKQKLGRKAPQTKANGKTKTKFGFRIGDNKAPEAQFAVDHDRTVAGLQNLGNTCFFNATVQGIASAPVIRDHFVGDSGGSLTGSIALGLQDVVRSLYSTGTSGATGKKASKRGAYNPQRLFAALCAYAPQFKGYQQHDSHEVLMALLNGLADEEAKACKQTPRLEEQDGDSKAPGLSGLFGGKLLSTVICGSCQHVSTTAEPFVALSLPVPLSLASKAQSKAVGTSSSVHAPTPLAKPLTNKEAKRLVKQNKRDAIKQARLAKQAQQGCSADETAGEPIVDAADMPLSADVIETVFDNAHLLGYAAAPGGGVVFGVELAGRPLCSPRGRCRPGLYLARRSSDFNPGNRKGHRATHPAAPRYASSACMQQHADLR